MANARFSDYATSGAFTLSLTRNQVSALGMLDGGMAAAYAPHLAALERKGLAEAVRDPSPDNPDRIEVRATHAGLLTIGLVREAGLTNGAADPIASELADLRAKLERARDDAAESRRVARSALARKAELELELENAKAKVAERKLSIRILPRDPKPTASDAELRSFAEADL